MNYLDKIENAFNGVNFLIKDAIEFSTVDIDDKDRYTEILDYNKSQLEFELNELDIRLRALRDKPNEDL